LATGRAASASATAGGGSRRLGLALLVIATAQLMVVLDATIVNVALPHIQQALGFSGSGLEWVVNAYAVTFGGLLLLGGRAGDILGRRRVLVAGPLFLVALHKVAERDSGVASSLLNAGQQVGGAIGLALLGTVAWTSVADSVRTQLAHAAAAAAQAGRPLPKPGTPRPRPSTTTPWRTASPASSLSPR
jgi:MFS family permease